MFLIFFIAMSISTVTAIVVDSRGNLEFNKTTIETDDLRYRSGADRSSQYRLR